MEYLNFYFQMALIQSDYGIIMIGELARQTPDVSRSKRHYILSRLIMSGYIERVRRGEYRLRKNSATWAIHTIEKHQVYMDIENAS